MLTKPAARTALVLLLLLTFEAFADHKLSRLYIFGDSLTDTGNFASVIGEFPNPPFFEGSRVSNGPVISERIAAGLGLSAEASLHLIGLAVGTNYAVATASAAGIEPTDLPTQVALFLANMHGVAPSDALYLLNIGGNDARKARDAPDLTSSLETLSAGVLAEDAAIRVLAEAGARRFLLMNVADVGQLPETRRLAAERGEPRLLKRATGLTRIYNRALSRLARRLTRSLGITIRQFDSFDASQRLIANAGQLGFTNTRDACLDSTFMPRPDCNFDTFVFFDEVHPTARAHEIVGREVLESLPRALVVETQNR